MTTRSWRPLSALLLAGALTFTLAQAPVSAAPPGSPPRLVPAAAAATRASAASEAPTAATTAIASADCPRLHLQRKWYGDVGARLQRVIDRFGSCSGPYRGPRRIAVFDWDNTMIKNDISDQTTFYLLRRSLIRQPRQRDWTTTSRWLTPAANTALKAACDGLARPGQRLPTGRRTTRAIACADEILSMRLDQATRAGAEGFAGDYDHRRMNAGYAWMAQLMAGRTPARVHQIARAARRVALRSPVGATWRVGSTTQIRWVRYYRPMRDLVRTLSRAGIQPWVISASPELWADVWGPGAGIPARRVVGIRMMQRHGRGTTHLVGCGGYPDGSDRIMTYVEGKRCWMNQAIRGIRGPAALREQPRRLRPIVAGGDSSTDVVMVGDAIGAHVVINRNSAELMCRAYDDADRRWLVTPMFIEPLPRFADGYPCSTTGAEQRDGSEGPVLRPDGSVVPDQVDTVFP